MYKEKIVDLLSGKEVWRDYTADEIAEVEKAQAEAKKDIAPIEKQQADRASALAKLAALGLTEDEIAAL